MQWKAMWLVPVFMIAAACGRNGETAAADSALARDLSLANQVTPYPPVDSLSALESGLAHGAAPASGTAGSATTRRSSASTAHPTHRTTSRTASSGTRTTGGTVRSSAGGEVVVKKNTKRDAAIGAVAGAAIGAATSKDKVKGAVIGGVVGGVLGGVIGNNVDVQKTRKPPRER